MISLLIKLLLLHFLADFPLQGDFLSKAKNQINPIPGISSYAAMFSHCFIQAGFVFLLTNSLVLFLAEFIIHYITDYYKCENKISFNLDQAIHISCKIIYVFILKLF